MSPGKHGARFTSSRGGSHAHAPCPWPRSSRCKSCANPPFSPCGLEAISLDLLLPFLELASVWRACHYGDVEHIAFLASHGFDVNETDAEGKTPLHLVASTGNLNMAQARHTLA